MSFFNELKRRNVFRVGIAYAVASWLLLQLSDILVPLLNLPESAQRFVLLLLIIGFIPALIFAWAFEMTPDGIKKEKSVDRSQSITNHTAQKLDRTIIAVLVVALAYFAYDKFLAAPEISAQPELATTEVVDEQVSVPVINEKSIAVLPFVNMSSDPEQEYFSDGISEEILNALAKVHELKVAGRTSSFAFKGKNQDLRLIGETLGVSHILEGSVRKAGDRVRITAQLIKVDDGFHLWSETYDRELTDIFAIQDEIASAILTQTKIQLLDATSITSTRVNTLAYDLYLLAKQKMRERIKEPLEAAATLLDQAIEADPTFAPAYAQRGITQLLLSDDQYGLIPETEALESAKVWFDQAMVLDPDNAEVLAGQGLYWRSTRLDREKAIAPLQRALEINPNLINASNWLAISLELQGRLREAGELRAKMVETDPLYRPGLSNSVRTFGIMGQPDKALAVVERARPFYPNDVMMDQLESTALLWQSNYSEGLKLAESAWKKVPTDNPSHNAYTLFLLITRQFELAEKVGSKDWRFATLLRQGKTEEAYLLAVERAANGQGVGNLVSFYGNQERYTELVELIESRWSDLDTWEADYPSMRGFGNNDMARIAKAYRSIGNEAKFADAMSRLKNSLEHQTAEGANNNILTVSEALYHTLADNQEQALAQLEKAANNGYVGFTSRLTDAFPILRPLEGLPRYEAVQQQMLEHLNAERAILELEPVELDRTL